MWLSALLNALFTGIAVFVALELHKKVVEIRRAYGGRLPLSELTKPYSTLIEDQKPEFMLPMTDEEYEEHMLNESGRGELLKSVLSKLPWKSKEPTSRSSDT